MPSLDEIVCNNLLEYTGKFKSKKYEIESVTNLCAQETVTLQKLHKVLLLWTMLQFIADFIPFDNYFS